MTIPLKHIGIKYTGSAKMERPDRDTESDRPETTVEFPEILSPGIAGFLKITLPPSCGPIYAVFRFDSSRLWISGPTRSRKFSPVVPEVGRHINIIHMH